MTEEEITITEESAESRAAALLDAVRKVFLASIGAAKAAQEEVTGLVTDTENYINKVVEESETFVNKLIDKGAIAESDGRQLISDMMEKRKSAVEESREKAQSGVDRRIEDVLSRFNVPTKTDLDELSKKIGQLNRKVDNLKKVQEKALAEEAATNAVENGSAEKDSPKKKNKKAKESAEEATT